MSSDAIIFESVSKIYKSHAEHHGGLKQYIIDTLRFQGKHKLRKKTLALRDISFRILTGSVVGFIGRNGAGKSTLLGLISSILRPTTGNITVRGRLSLLLELGAGFHPDLTGRENIELYAILMGYRKKYVLENIDAIIAFSEIEEFIDTPTRYYSNGMLARLGFGIISQLEKDIVVIDEVLAVGDIAFQKKCMDTMQRLKEAGKTIILVSHSISTVESFCERVIWIQDHTIRMDGPADEVVATYKQSAKEKEPSKDFNELPPKKA